MAKTLTVTVKHIELEGGFWGLVDDAGNQYEPEILPANLQQEGRRARVKVRSLDTASFRMWGQPVRIERVEALL